MIIEVEDRVPKSARKPIIADNGDLELIFVFDTEWDGLEKIARFVLEDSSYKDVQLVNDRCTIPIEVCKPGHLSVGVISGVKATTSLDILVQQSIISKSGEVLDDVTPDVLTQLLKFLKVSDGVPTHEGLHYEKVWNAKPKKGDPIGWVYTEGEWVPFGTVGASNMEVVEPAEEGAKITTSDGHTIVTSDGYILTIKKED